MMKIKKNLVLGIIFLFLGVAVAPSINFNVVKASQDDDLVEVTTQACGIQGYGDTTVKLTREQYNDLEQYLVEFHARLNQTVTREEAIPIFKKAVVELDKYRLLPKGMSVEKALNVFTDEKLNSFYKFVEGRQYWVWKNMFCLFFADIERANLILHVPLPIFLLMLINNYLLSSVLFVLCLLLSSSPVMISLFAMESVFSAININVYSLGAFGINNFEYYQLAIYGFIGLKIVNPDTGNGFLFGWAALIGYPEGEMLL
jgi:hypothetical protein